MSYSPTPKDLTARSRSPSHPLIAPFPPSPPAPPSLPQISPLRISTSPLQSPYSSTLPPLPPSYDGYGYPSSEEPKSDPESPTTMTRTIEETLRLKIGADPKVGKVLLEEYEEALDAMMKVIRFCPKISVPHFTRHPQHPSPNPAEPDSQTSFNEFLSLIERVGKTRIFQVQNKTYARILDRQELHNVIKDTENKDWKDINDMVLIKVWTVADFWFPAWCLVTRELRGQVEGMVEAVEKGEGVVVQGDWGSIG